MTPKKILVVKCRSLGDTALLTAPLEVLSRVFPSAKIHVVVTAKWASLLNHHPSVSRVWKYERRNERAARAKTIAKLGIELRREGFDLAINFHASPSTALLTFASGAKTRSIHFHGHKQKNLYSTVEIPGKGVVKPIIERDMDAIRALGVFIPEGVMPKIHLEPGEFVKGEEMISSLDLQDPILCLGIGASRPTKIWPVENYAALAQAWVRETSGSVLTIAGPEEEALLDQFKKLISGSPEQSKIKTLKDLSVRELAAILRQCGVYAGNDSGPRHIAVALETPTVTLIGPEHPLEWHPYPREVHPYLFIDNLGCRRDALPGYPAWCNLDVCTVEQHKCLKKIAVQDVLVECKRVAHA